ncbi:DUF1990 family protein [Streptomyces sp. CNQ085]|uniref:DUF1990 family protein n=1 Tax=Streptomyces sp. CNQ085 TaxID=2886944 RepID=UPI001F505B24|nr:DUF1990 family protein [Streptomyces sp. CNQ085]MCI0385401.1 DUF1990 domain-containing protein [Streptomyces sp. CNQ085]
MPGGADGERASAAGRCRGVPERGEEAFVVEPDDDGAVWLEVRAFSRPEVWWARVAGSRVLLFQRLYARRCAAVPRRLSSAPRGLPHVTEHPAGT